MRRRSVALTAATLISLAGATVSWLRRRPGPPAEPAPPVRDPSPPVPAPIRVLDVGIRLPPPQPAPMGLFTRVLLSPLALLAAVVRLRRRLGRSGPRMPG